MDSFEQALGQHIRSALEAGVVSGEFRSDLNVDTDAVLVRYALNGVSTLVAASPSDAPGIVANATRTLLAALDR